MYTKIDIKNFINKLAITFEKNKTYDIGYALVLAQTRLKELFFCRTIVLYNFEDNIIYDLISEKVIPIIDLKKDATLINYEPIYKQIREQKLDNLRMYLNDINPRYVDEDDVLKDLHNLPMLKTFPIEREYALSVDEMKYVRPIPNDILRSKNLPSLKISNGKIIFKDQDIYNFDEQLIQNNSLQKKIMEINKNKTI